MSRVFAALLAGTLFGLGLAISQMMDPARVIGFLDVTGQWDPTLALVMGGALAVAVPGFWLVLKQPHPLLSDHFSLPTKRDLDPALVGGAALFGLGWGLAGFCPGPAIAALSVGSGPVVTFVLAMIAGQVVVAVLRRGR